MTLIRNPIRNLRNSIHIMVTFVIAFVLVFGVIPGIFGDSFVLSGDVSGEGVDGGDVAFDNSTEADHFSSDSSDSQPLRIMDITDNGFSNDDGGTFEFLRIIIFFNVAVSDEYTFYGSLSPCGLEIFSHNGGYFNSGVNNISLNIDGGKLFESGQDGPYTIDLFVSNGGPIIDDTIYETQMYRYQDFNPSPGPVDPPLASLEVKNNTVMIKTQVFTAVVYEREPRITYYYTPGDDPEGGESPDKESLSFSVVFTTLRAMSYNGTGFPDADDAEVLYSADLTAADFSSQKELFENYHSFDFEVSSFVELSDGEMTYPVRIGFQYSSAMNDADHLRKFDIDIKPLQRIPGVDFLVIDHAITGIGDDLEVIDGETADGESGKISFVSRLTEEELGYYSWLKRMDVTTDDGSVHEELVHGVTDLGPSRAGDGSSISSDQFVSLSLWYGYNTSVNHIHHDPVVGLNPAVSFLSDASSDVVDAIVHNPWIFVISMLSAVVVVFGSLYGQARKVNGRR